MQWGGKPRAAAVVTAVALVATACGGGDRAASEAADGEPGPTVTTAAAKTATPITVALAEQNGSKQSGTATLTPSADGTSFVVTLDVSPPSKKFPGEPQHAHIHGVTCAEYEGMADFNAQLATVTDPLTDLVDGRSETTVSAKLAMRATGRYSINVHEEAFPYTAVACGDIEPPE